jgi:hypothetical protein
MNIKTLLITFMIAGFMTNNIHTAENSEKISTVSMQSCKGSTFLRYYPDEKSKAGLKVYWLDGRNKLYAPIMTIDKEGKSSIIFAKEFEQKREMRNYFVSECALGNQFHSQEKFYVLKEKKNVKERSIVDCKALESMINDFLAKQAK